MKNPGNCVLYLQQLQDFNESIKNQRIKNILKIRAYEYGYHQFTIARLTL